MEFQAVFQAKTQALNRLPELRSRQRRAVLLDTGVRNLKLNKHSFVTDVSTFAPITLYALRGLLFVPTQGRLMGTRREKRPIHLTIYLFV